MQGGEGRAVIDTRAPFRSVKEAVTLFGEKVLAEHVYGPKLNNVTKLESKSTKQAPNQNMGALKSELEEMKERLERSREEAKRLESAIKSLTRELEETRQELQHVKSNTLGAYMGEFEFQVPRLKKFVSFASPPSLVRTTEKQLDRVPSFRKQANRKPFGWLFNRNKTNT